MRRALIAMLVLLAGCGSAEPAPDAADINRANDADEVVFLQRVLGDDPISESVSLRADGTAAVRRGGGRGYWDVAVELSPHQTETALEHVRAAPFAVLAGNTITPGGFGGNDNDRRYMLRRDKLSVTVTERDVPEAMRPLVADLNALIDGDLGTIVADDRHFSAAGVTGSDSSDDAATPQVYENTPATPIERSDAPEAERHVSCYGSGTRQSGTPRGIRAGPLTLEVDGPSVAAVVEPGGSVTIAAQRPVLRFGGGAFRVVRFEGCSDSTSGGGAARFEGRVSGCARVEIYAGGEAVRRRINCGR